MLPCNRRIRIILAGVLSLLVIVALVALSRQPGESASGENTEPTTVTDVDLIVQTLFAQTAIAEANVSVNITQDAPVVIINAPTLSPTPIPTQPVFPAGARQALDDYLAELAPRVGRPAPLSMNGPLLSVDQNYSLVSALFAYNPRVGIINTYVDEAWCLQTAQPAIVYRRSSALSAEPLEIRHFIARRQGALWSIETSRGGNEFLSRDCR